MGVGSLEQAFVGVVSGLKEAEEAVGCTTDGMSVAEVVLDHGTVGLDPVEDTLNLFQGPDLDHGIYLCPFVLDDGIRVRGNLDLAWGEEAVVCTPADLQ